MIRFFFRDSARCLSVNYLNKNCKNNLYYMKKHIYNVASLNNTIL